MTAPDEHLALLAAERARAADRALSAAQQVREVERVRFIRDALRIGWAWSRIGAELGTSARAAHAFWTRHRMQASRL